MKEIIQRITANVLTALYQPFWFALSLSVVFMLVAKKYSSIKDAVKEWLFWFKSDKAFRREFLLTFYTVMILFKTLMNRSMWANPVSNVMGNWWIYNQNGDLTTECFENILLFVPFTFLLLWTLHKKILPKVTFKATITKSIVFTFLFSFTIEMLQLFLRLGTWQFSDLFYNTLGGAIGGFAFYIIYRMRK